MALAAVVAGAVGDVGDLRSRVAVGARDFFYQERADSPTISNWGLVEAPTLVGLADATFWRTSQMAVHGLRHRAVAVCWPSRRREAVPSSALRIIAGWFFRKMIRPYWLEQLVVSVGKLVSMLEGAHEMIARGFWRRRGRVGS